jgi:ubiquinone biosynthesis protein COQ9
MAKAATSTEDEIIDAFMRVIGRDGWHGATLDVVAREANVGVADIAAHFDNRFDILATYGKHIDIAALKSAEADGGSQAPRDRLFDILMARFDAVLPHKKAVQAIAASSRRDPGLAAFFAMNVSKSMGLIASCAGVDTSGLLGRARVHALSGLYLGVTREWLRDDSEDLSKTMAALDKALARADRWESQVSRMCKSKPKAAYPAPLSD